ncbi:MAG: hypothetical protein Q8N23_18530 [Archangium sp.]|nr:hypothetical protein [Archangium sp.]MDP3572690.1 hypothetical protein [Archangium sp.]
MLTTLVVLLSAQCPPATGTLTIDPLGPTNSLGQRLPLVRWTISCPPQNPPSCPNVPSAALGDLRTEFAADPTSAERVGQGTGSSGASGEGPLPGLSQTLFGANVQFSALVSCNNRGSDVRLVSAAVVFAPTLNANSRSALLRNGVSIIGPAEPDRLAIGQPVFLSASFEVLPALTEDVTVRVEGAGVSFSKAYRREAGGGKDAIVAAYRRDPQANVTPTSAGTVKLWLEFAGIRSAEAVFTVSTGGTSGGGAGGGIGAGGGGAGAGEVPAGGCRAVPGAELMLLTAAGALRRRRRSQRG